MTRLAEPSQALDEKAGSDLYNVARALFPQPDTLPAFVMDKSHFLDCPKKPEIAVAIMRYLADDGPDDWRGATNVFSWLGLATELGIGTPADPALARRWYLRSRMHWQVMPTEKWSDGVDDDLLANISRAGMRPYLDGLAAITDIRRNGGEARIILAEATLPSDPLAARRWLRTPHILALNRLIELEETGAVPTLHDRADNAFWADIWRRLPNYRKWAARLVKGVKLENGGSIPTDSARPTRAKLKSGISTAHLDDGAEATRDPIAIRALVDPAGKAIYVEDCRATELGPGVTLGNLSVRLDAIRVYDLDKLPALSSPASPGTAPYRWVILPAIHFKRLADEKVAVNLVDLPAEACLHSGMQDTPIAAPARMAPPSTR